MGRNSLEKVRLDNPAKKEAWVRQLIPFYQNQGIKAISMDKVADYLSVSKATVYKYFKSQEEILSMGIDTIINDVRGFVPILADREKQYLDRYYEGVSHLSNAISGISNLFLADLKLLYPRLWDKVEFFIDFAIGILRNFYQEGIQLNVLKPLNLGILTLSDRFLFNALSDPEFLKENNLSIQEAFEQYFQMKFFGIVNT